MTTDDGALMRAMEQRVRTALGTAAAAISAGDLPGRPIPAPASWAARGLRSWAPQLRVPAFMVPAAAATGVTAIAVAAAVVLPMLAGSSSPAPATGAARALPGAPAFFAGVVEKGPSSRPPHTAVSIFSSATGRVVASIPSPQTGWIDSVGRLGGDSTFVVAAVGSKGCASRLYRFSISATGQPGPLTPLSVPRVTGQVGELAGSVDGSELAYTASGPCSPRTQHLVGAINLATNKVTTWTFPIRSGRGTTSVGSLSLTADGSRLGFLAGLDSPPQSDPVWVLPTSAPGGLLTRHARKVLEFSKAPFREILSPSGARVTVESAPPALEAAGKPPASAFVDISEYSTSTGRRFRAGGRVSLHSKQMAELSLSSDAAGRHVIAYGFLGGRATLMDLRSGRSITLKSGDLSRLDTEGALTSIAW